MNRTSAIADIIVREASLPQKSVSRARRTLPAWLRKIFSLIDKQTLVLWLWLCSYLFKAILPCGTKSHFEETVMNHLLATTSRAVFAKAHEGDHGHSAPAQGEVTGPAADAAIAAHEAGQSMPVVPTVSVTIASLDVALPLKFKAGDTLDETTARILDAAYQRQYKNNKDAAYKAWETKASDWDAAKAKGEAKGERPANPCTVEALLSDYTAYQPQVGDAARTSLEKLRDEAGLRRFKEMIDEHNEIVAKGGKGRFGTEPAKLPSGKGAADERSKFVGAILASEKQAAHVQRHIDAILAERKAAESAPAAAKPVDSKSMLESLDLDV
jgi:hypothetical protein